MITVRNIKITCKDKTFYNFFNSEQREQNRALNTAITLLHINNALRSIDSGAEERLLKSIKKLESNITKYEKELKNPKLKDDKRDNIIKAIKTTTEIIETEKEKFNNSEHLRKELDKEFADLYINKSNLYQTLDSLGNFKYKRTISLVEKEVKQDYNNNFTEIVTGKMSLPNYRSDCPLMIDGAQMKIIKVDNDYVLKIMLGYELNIILGKRINENMEELRKTLDRCESGEYKICQSKIKRDKNKNMIVLLYIDIPISNTYEPVEGRVLGIDLGIKHRVYMCLSDNTYVKKSLGNINGFLKVRQQMQVRRRKLQEDLVITNGGKGRKKKLQLLDKLKESEKNFVKNYDHNLSKKIIEFAVKNKCESINLEKLTKDGFDNSLIRDWGYYQLCTMIEYKAKRKGIIVNYINPAYTSQKCSKCGNIDSNNRPTQEKFVCTKCGFELNADHNASINIARSKDFK